MDELSSLKINLLTIKPEGLRFNVTLNGKFFKDQESDEISDACLHVDVSVTPIADNSFNVQSTINGNITIPCVRCLDDMQMHVDIDEVLIVKLGVDFSEDDDLITVPMRKGIFDLSPYLYQFVTLSIPIKHVHEPGMCNVKMMDSLSKHLIIRSEEEDDGTDDSNKGIVDPRWKDLLKLKN